MSFKDDLRLVADLCDIDEGLTPWEVGFAESLAKQTEAGRELSDKQRSIAESILERLQ